MREVRAFGLIVLVFQKAFLGRVLLMKDRFAQVEVVRNTSESEEQA